MATLHDNFRVESPLKPYSFVIKRYRPGTLRRGVTPSLSGGDTLAANLSEIAITSDASAGTCTFGLSHPDTTVYDETAGELMIPEIGDEIAIFATSVGETGDGSIIFKGFVDNSQESRADNGIILGVTCQDMKGRMMDEAIKKTYNEMYDIAGRPNFSEADMLSTPAGDSISGDNVRTLYGDFWTVEQIVNDIMRFADHHALEVADKYKPLVYFLPEDIDFRLVPALKDFVPGQLSFDNVSILEAVYQTIASAGSYRLVYDPRRDKLVITQVNLKADRAGEERILVYATADKDKPNKDYVYEDVNVISDSSTRKTEDLATIMRMYTGKVRWYSGHFIIDRDHEQMDDLTEPNDDAIYYLSNKNWDGFTFVPPVNSIKFTDGSSEKPINIVGCPLYPQWDPLKGYAAYERKLSNVKIIPRGWAPTETETIDKAAFDPTPADKYDDDAEREGVTQYDKAYTFGRGFQDAMGANDLNIALGYTYEAWFPWPGPCPYCDGQGTVSSVPQEWRDNADTWFGDSRDSNGEPNRPGMTPFNYAFEVVKGEKVPTNHPVPWLNTCPACRGHGREPMFKITNILGDLVDLPPDKVKIGENAVQTRTDRTWGEMVQDLSYRYAPQVQLETIFIDKTRPAVDIKSANRPPHPLAGVQSLTGKVVTIFPADEKIQTLYRTQVSVGADAAIDNVRGNVVFKQRAGINCIKRLKHIATQSFRGDDGTTVYYLKDKDDNEATLYNDRAFNHREESFWRPARAWITCYFSRDRYDNFFRGVPNDPQDVALQNPEGEIDQYRVGSYVRDGRSVFEIRTKHPDDDTEFTARPVVKSMANDEYMWEICPYDMYLMPVPLKSGNSWDPTGVLAAMRDAEYLFPLGRFHVVEPLRDSEVGSFSKTVDKSVLARSDIFAKNISWVHRDDRFKLVERAVKELERRNNIQVNGNVEVRGENYDLQNGLGYVELNDGLKACVVKIQHRFSGSFVTLLELGTEEMRVGEEKEEDKDYKRKLNERINNLFLKVERVNIGPRKDNREEQGGSNEPVTNPVEVH